MKYINHFGEKSEDYSRYRPDYPSELYHYLANLTVKHDLAWDCGTGNGQAAMCLAAYFELVIGSDVNQAQLDVARKKNNIRYHCWSAEKTELSDATVDLITIAQALHWFDLDAFYREVKRVSKEAGIISAWCYSLPLINEEIDAIVMKLYAEILGEQYWPTERRYIDEEYQTIFFPFRKIITPKFAIVKEVNLTQFMGYLNTWSAVKEYQKVNDNNPTALIYPDLLAAWEKPEEEHVIRWPIHLLAGHVF
ncbi:MAG: class I SAM-dependent methyltransferase [Gammaproteobacteria bacterium]|nr:class I SAM-dependent methyltransferase [Gammaproteobacteria bacterium]MCW5583137.1 class I SAM-dependent methyltransferase [Gammaproteobacteria bacterium]